MKKLFSLMLALALVMSVTTAAFATSQGPSYDVQPTISKTYKVNNGTAGEADFEFEFYPYSYTDNDGNTYYNDEIQLSDGWNTINFPDIANVTIHFDPITQTTTNTMQLNVNPDDYDLGVYKYMVYENEGNVAGVTYSRATYYLVLTVVRDEQNNKHFVAAFHYETTDGDKVDESAFENTYDSGSLTVTKNITGNMADMDKKFTFTVAFASDKDWNASLIDVDGTQGTWSEDHKTYTVELGHQDSVTFSNLPAGVTYTVSEDNENYTSSEVYSDENKTISANDTDTVNVTNTLTKDIDTGISMDSLPYILMLAAAGIGMVVFFAKKRSHNA